MRLLEWKDKPYEVAEQVDGGQDYQSDIAGLTGEIHALDLDADTYDADFAKLRASRKRLVNLAATATPEVRYVPTGKSWGEHWFDLGDAGRRALLSGLRATAVKDGAGLRLVIDGREDVLRYVAPDEEICRSLVREGAMP